MPTDEKLLTADDLGLKLQIPAQQVYQQFSALAYRLKPRKRETWRWAWSEVWGALAAQRQAGEVAA